ncbi:MAG TPA: hypothetical protein VHN14_25340 [Kofleriaceae bacterium]|jgi:hypothetical protein|nr:hypothetical protein [Kofleriaceae bacterium]
MSSLDLALQRALSVRLNLQIGLSQLPIVEEWMDIHLDRWLEHLPMPPDMPNGQTVNYLAMFGSDVRRLWWGAWGDPHGFIPKMADYFKLCNIAKSDTALLDQIGEQLEPKLVGSWIGVWGGKVTTGWHFLDPHPWLRVEPMFGTHEAKYQVKKWVEDHQIERIERFMQSIGDAAFSEIELAIPGATVDDKVQALSDAFVHFTGAPLDAALVAGLRTISSPEFALAIRIRGGKISRVGALIPGIAIGDILQMCSDAKVPVDPRLNKLVGALGEGIARVEYGRAGDRAGVDIYLEPSESVPSEPAPTSSQAN